MPSYPHFNKKKILQSKVKIVCLKAKILNYESLHSSIPTNAKIELGLEKNKILIVINDELYLVISANQLFRSLCSNVITQHEGFD